MASSDIYDCAIIGAGVIGLSSAYFLQKRGLKVLLLERGDIGKGASHGNCGMMSRSHAPPIAMPGLIPKALKWMLKPDAPLYIKPTINPKRLLWLLRFAGRCNWQAFWDSAGRKNVIIERSVRLFDEIVRSERIDCDYAPVGHLVAFRDRVAFQDYHKMSEILHELGIRCEMLDRDQALALEPALSDHVVGAAYKSEDAHFRPDKYVQGLAQVVRSQGAHVETGASVQSVEYQEQAVLRTAHSRYRARSVLLATGAYAPELGRQLGFELAIEPAKGYSITMTPPSLMPKHSVVFYERGVAATPFATAFRLGSTYEFSGFDLRPNPVRIEALKRAAREYLRTPEGEHIEEEWFNFRPMTVDGLPYLAQSERHPRAFVAAGHGTLGMTMSAASGERMADMIGAYLGSLT
jgi:D-amino-acid dehydrogenase